MQQSFKNALVGLLDYTDFILRIPNISASWAFVKLFLQPLKIMLGCVGFQDTLQMQGVKCDFLDGQYLYEAIIKYLIRGLPTTTWMIFSISATLILHNVVLWGSLAVGLASLARQPQPNPLGNDLGLRPETLHIPKLLNYYVTLIHLTSDRIFLEFRNTTRVTHR